MTELTVELGKTYRTQGGHILRMETEIPRFPHEPIVFRASDGTLYNAQGLTCHDRTGWSANHASRDPIIAEAPPERFDANNFIMSLRKDPRTAFDILRLWGEETFGPVTPSRIVERAQEEMNVELVKEVADDVWTEKALEEAADVVVILSRAPGLWNAIERKMHTNFLRKWDVKGDGTGYHIPQED
jgi:hypothetical protein